MSGITENHRIQMRKHILQYLTTATGQHYSKLQGPAAQIEEGGFRKSSTLADYRLQISQDLETVQKKIDARPQNRNRNHHAQAQSRHNIQQVAAQAAHVHAQAQAAQVAQAAQAAQVALHAPNPVPMQPPNHTSTLQPGVPMPMQPFSQDAVMPTGGYPYFPGQHPANAVAPQPSHQQQHAYAASTRPPGIQLGDQPHFMVPQQAMHPGQNIPMHNPTPPPMDNFQQVPNMYHRVQPHQGLQMRPPVNPMQKMMQHSQPIPQHIPANPLSPAPYPQTGYPQMGVPRHGNTGIMPSAVPVIQQTQQQQLQIPAQNPPDPGAHQPQLESLDRKTLEDMFMKKRAELHTKYFRELSTIISYLSKKTDDPKRESQMERALDHLKKWRLFISVKDHPASMPNITVEHYRSLLQLEVKIPSYIHQFPKLQQKKYMEARVAALQGLPANQFDTNVVSAPPTQHMPQAPKPVVAHDLAPSDAKPSPRPLVDVAKDTSKTGGRENTQSQVEQQKDSNTGDVHKTASNRPNRKHTAQALVSIIKGMPSPKLSQLQHEIEPLAAFLPRPPSNTPKGFFAASKSSAEDMAQPLVIDSITSGQYTIEGSNIPKEHHVACASDSSDVVVERLLSAGGIQRQNHLERKRKRIEGVMGDSVVVKVVLEDETPTGMGDMLIVDWVESDEDDAKDPIGESNTSAQHKGTVENPTPPKTVAWKRLRLNVGPESDSEDESTPTALFYSKDASYGSPKSVAARSLFHTKVQSTRSNLAELVETWASCCEQITEVYS